MLGDAFSPYLIGALADAFKPYIHSGPSFSSDQFTRDKYSLTPEEYTVEFKALQYALFTCCFAQVNEH